MQPVDTKSQIEALITPSSDQVVKAIIDRLNRGDQAAINELIEIEREFIEEKAKSRARREFQFISEQSSLSSAPQAVIMELLNTTAPVLESR